MTLCNPAEMAACLSPGARLLGLDLGEKTIGLALSDLTRIVATPLKTLKKGKFSLKTKKEEK